MCNELENIFSFPMFSYQCHGFGLPLISSPLKPLLHPSPLFSISQFILAASQLINLNHIFERFFVNLFYLDTVFTSRFFRDSIQINYFFCFLLFFNLFIFVITFFRQFGGKPRCGGSQPGELNCVRHLQHVLAKV